jgi:hypothetical protein
MTFAILVLCLIIYIVVTEVTHRIHHGGHSPSHVAAVSWSNTEVISPPHIAPDNMIERPTPWEQVVTMPQPIPVSAVHGVQIEALKRVEAIFTPNF